MTKTDLYTFIARYKLGVLNTIAAGCKPQSALVGYAVTSALELVFDTIKTSRKYPNLVATPECSFVIGWSGERTVQYEGTAVELRSPELAPYQEIYFKAWPDGPAHLAWPGLVYFLVRPSWIRYSDYDASPPLIVEFDFETDDPVPRPPAPPA